MINPWAGEACQTWLATHLGEENSDFKHIARVPCWHCPSLLGHGSCISCFFPELGSPILVSRLWHSCLAELVFYLIFYNYGRGYDLGTATGLLTVVWARLGHAPCKTSNFKNPNVDHLLSVPASQPECSGGWHLLVIERKVHAGVCKQSL